MTLTIRFWRQIQINFCSLSAEHKNKIKILHGKNQLTKKGVCTKLLSTQGNDCVVLGRQLAKQIEKQRRPFSAAALVEINTWRNMNWAFFPRNILTEKSTIEVLQFNNDSNLMWRLAQQKSIFGNDAPCFRHITFTNKVWFAIQIFAPNITTTFLWLSLVCEQIYFWIFTQKLIQLGKKIENLKMRYIGIHLGKKPRNLSKTSLKKITVLTKFSFWKSQFW